ncbi:hypothetical protein KBD61_00610 [Patescibacteria group bacterium]|nr:hypothetical protein [Patescibacteria group bacterium]MBP9709508.1 hypothetical protein [Patescibacteria group bacterium]
MQEELEARIEIATTLCDAQIRRRRFRQQNPPTLSTRALNQYGPSVIAKGIQQVVADLTGSHSLPAARTDKYWKAFFSTYAQVEHVTLVHDELATSRCPGASSFFEAQERVYMRTTYGAGIQLFGHLFNRPDLVRVGREDGWQTYGFQLFYDELLGTFSDPTPLQHEAVLMVARLLTYCVSMLETISVLEQLEPVRPLLDALNTGCIPVAYDKTTGTLFLKNWR